MKSCQVRNMDKLYYRAKIYSKYAALSLSLSLNKTSQIEKFMRPTWGPPGSCRPHMGPMLVSWTLLSGMAGFCRHVATIVGYGLLILSSWLPGALQPAKEQRNLILHRRRPRNLWVWGQKPSRFSSVWVSAQSWAGSWYFVINPCRPIKSNTGHNV